MSKINFMIKSFNTSNKKIKGSDSYITTIGKHYVIPLNNRKHKGNPGGVGGSGGGGDID